jgi:protein TonB
VALLRFTVRRDGRLARWTIERGTGDAELDAAVEAMVRQARLPPMPAEMPGESLDVVVPVRFLLR